jgi:nitroimidazol reductase NimA-like FMN-containing flavoprotein (pyridoxamine 5'-phosphate oxidase superfamily)
MAADGAARPHLFDRFYSMNSPPMDDGRHHRHEDLDVDECWNLLRSAQTGRIAFVHGSRIEVFPVNYVVGKESIFFRTSAYGAVGASLRDAPASFQIDDFDDSLQEGWSVLASGHARFVEAADLRAELRGTEWPEPWADGIRWLFIGIHPEQVTGRRVHRG